MASPEYDLARVIRIEHTGPMTLGSLDSVMPSSLFRPGGNASASEPFDPYNMGWEPVPSTSPCRFEIRNLGYATAEGAATLAATAECLRHEARRRVDLEVSENSRRWADALGFGQISAGQFMADPVIDFSEPSGCFAYPLWRCIVETRRDCEELADKTLDRLVRILDATRCENKEELTMAAGAIVREALLNVLEHAYPANRRRVAFCAITVSPAPRYDQLGRSAYASVEERRWFDELQGIGRMLEVAISDYGLRIPATLWQAFQAEQPQAFRIVESLKLGTKQGLRNRTSIHNQIAVWACRHHSTRKQAQHLRDELASYSWRGLHRAVNLCARYTGNIVLRTGSRVSF